MALIHWWPLNGDTGDRIGDRPGTLLGTATLTEPGKLGTCLSVGDGTKITAGISVENCNLLDEISDEYSAAMWIKVHGTHVHYEGAFISSGDWNNKRWTFGINQANNRIQPLTNASNQNYISLGKTLTTNQWYHVTTVYKDGKAYLYLDGKLINSVTATAPYQSSATNLCIGRETYAAGYFSFNGDICDVRIYDHALSIEEVRELSKGLMVHYTFNDTYAEEITNLVTPGVNTWGKLTVNVTGKHTSDGHYTVTTTTANSGTRGQIRLYFPLSILTTGTSYYFSCKYKVVSGTGNLALVDWCDSSLNQKTSTNCGSYMILTAYCSTTRTYNSTYRFLDMNIDANSIVEVWDIQLQTNKVTPYTIGTRPSMLANEAGYDNPISTQNLTLTTDTNCGSYAGIFDSSKPTQIRTALNLGGETDVSIACWLYPQSGTTAFTDNALYCVISGTNISLYAYGRSNSWLDCGSCLTLDAWNHVVVTYSATERVAYVNGKEIKRGEVSGTFEAKSSLDVGYGSSTTRAFNGKISDFRIYRTPLTAEDVKILYESRASVDKEQDVFSNEFIENFNENMVTTDSWEQGGIQDADGRDANNMANRLRTKYLPVLGGLKYTYKAATGINVRYIHYYDADNKWISAYGIMANSTAQTTPDNAAYVRWVLQYTDASLAIPVANITDYGAVMMPSLIYEVADIVDSSETVVNKTYNINTNDICENHKAGIYKKGTMTGRNFNEI